MRQLRSDERGFTLVFVAVALPALLGLIGLVLDVGRLFTLDAQLADVADAAALAAASQLDRSENAISKARIAAQALTNEASFAGGADATVDLTFRFAGSLSELRDSTTYSLPEDAGPDAVYVEVTTADRSITTSFVQLVGAQTAPVRRSAVAESQYYACDVTPTIMCQSNPDRFAQRTSPGRQFLLRAGVDYSDGSLAFLDAPGDPRGESTPRTLASNTPNFCYTDRTTIRAGATLAQFDDAVNVRFDRYVNASGPIASDLAAYPPAPNVIKGQRYKTCSSPPDAADVNPPYHLPRDSAFRSGTASAAYDQGAGDWKATAAYGGSGTGATTAIDEYISWNHSDKDTSFQNRLRTSATRYELYLGELGLTKASDERPVNNSVDLATMPTGGPKAGPFSNATENAAPACYAGRLRPSEARRRIIYLAIVDCSHFSDNATAAKLSKNVGKFFLTEPSNRGTLLVEFIQMLKPGNDDDKLRHVVQLVDTK